MCCEKSCHKRFFICNNNLEKHGCADLSTLFFLFWKKFYLVAVLAVGLHMLNKRGWPDGSQWPNSYWIHYGNNFNWDVTVNSLSSYLSCWPWLDLFWCFEDWFVCSRAYTTAQDIEVCCSWKSPSLNRGWKDTGEWDKFLSSLKY